MREAALAVSRVLVFLTGFAVVALTAGSAVRTVVLPRAVPARITRVVFLAVRGLYRLRLGRAAGYEQREAVMASYAPVSLLVLLQVWLVLVWLGYAAMLWAAGAGTTAYDLVLSGSSLVTLGFVAPRTTVLTLLAISEAAVGRVLLALLITTCRACTAPSPGARRWSPSSRSGPANCRAEPSCSSGPPC